jgi:hypothetical protein
MVLVSVLTITEGTSATVFEGGIIGVQSLLGGAVARPRWAL